jgi:hypothetical protein
MKIVRLTTEQYQRIFESKKHSYKTNFQSVGRGGVNKTEDVEYILSLFNCAGISTDGIIDTCEGDFGQCEAFLNLIGDYQLKNLGFKDKRIDPKRETVTHLLAVCNGEDPYAAVAALTTTKSAKAKEIAKEKSSEPLSSAPASFEAVVAKVIDELEGGYYHPDMLKDGRVKDGRYAGSGETMMGIDRVAGGSANDTPAGKVFWSIIDNANARQNWPWLYRGGKLESKLRDLAGQIIKPLFLQHSSRYLTPEARKIVMSYNPLLFNFIYAAWNGAGWFQRFAKKINKAVANGVTNPEELFNIAIDARLNSGSSLIKQGGKKIQNLFK